MSCSGCRVLRKRCSDSCSLRSCLQWIQGADAQSHATAFVAKFFGRQGLTNFINAVPENERAALFRSLLYEACGRTVNPVHGAVGLLWSGNWQVCQDAVATVLKGEILHAFKASPPAPLDHSAFIHFPLTELGRNLIKAEPQAPNALSLCQNGSMGAMRDRVHEMNVEQDSFSPSIQLFSSSNRGRDLPEIEPLSMKNKSGGNDFRNTLKRPFKSENQGELHRPAKKDLKRKYEEAISQADQVRPERASKGLETLLEAIHRRDQETETPPKSDIVLDLALCSYPFTPAYDLSQRSHEMAAATRTKTPEDHSVSSEGSVTNLDSEDLSVSCVALDRQRLCTLSKPTAYSEFVA